MMLLCLGKEFLGLDYPGPRLWQKCGLMVCIFFWTHDLSPVRSGVTRRGPEQFPLRLEVQGRGLSGSPCRSFIQERTLKGR